jgi:hypothetical protein
MNKWGIHWPNGYFSDIEGIFGLDVSNYTFLHEQADYALAMRKRSPDGHLHCRFYLPNWRAADPTLWARTCAREYNRERTCPLTGEKFTLKSLRVEVSPSNEMNLPDEGGGSSYTDYTEINQWMIFWFVEFTALTNIPYELTHWSALAVGHSDDQNDYGYVGLLLCKDSIELYHYLDEHIYWEEGYVRSIFGSQSSGKSGGKRFELAHNLFPNKQIAITECGQFNTKSLLAPVEIVDFFRLCEETPYIEFATPFIYCDPTGKHYGNDWAQNLDIKHLVTYSDKLEVGAPVSTRLERVAQNIFDRANIPWNPNSAFCKAYLEYFKAGKFLGMPQSKEYPVENTGYFAQEFASGYLWAKEGEWIVKDEFPPFLK